MNAVEVGLPDRQWRWPFKVVATVPIVWLLVEGARADEGGVLREVEALGPPLALALTVGFFAAVAFFCRDLQRVLELLPREARVSSPKSVWLMMVLPFNFVEDFFIVSDVSQALERGGFERFAARSWAFGWCSAQLVSLLPGTLGKLGSLVALPLWAVHWVSLRAALRELVSTKQTSRRTP